MEPTDRVFKNDTGPLEYTPLDDFDRPLIVAREALPGWDIFRAGWGYIAVPANTVVFLAVDVGGLVAKLRRHEQQAPSG